MSTVCIEFSDSFVSNSSRLTDAVLNVITSGTVRKYMHDKIAKRGEKMFEIIEICKFRLYWRDICIESHLLVQSYHSGKW